MTAIELRRNTAPRRSVLDGWDSPSWNRQTRAVVARRLDEVPERRFFDAAEWALLEAVIARLLPQDRVHPIPVTPFIDAKLEEDRGEGYHYADMPRQRDAWRLGLAALGREAVARHGRAFIGLEPDLQDEVLRAIQHDEVRAEWPYPARRFFQDVLLKTAVSFYYAHPAAWTEIGFGGPASPRGYVRLGLNRRDGWEPPPEPWPPA